MTRDWTGRGVRVRGAAAWLGLLAACGGASGGPARQPPLAAAAGNDSWARASWEDRHDAMTFLVLPNMARLFQRHAGAAFPTLTCRTCHGPDAEEVHYKMPHGLPALDPAHLPAADDPDPGRARTARFMEEEVTPQMADLLGEAAHDPRTNAGFSCFRCHPARGAR